MAGSRETVADHLRDGIVSGKYKPGDKLPSTRDLSATYGVARNTANDALRLLAHEGFVEIKDKSGAVVLSPDRRDDTPESRLADVRTELLELQSSIFEFQGRLSELSQRVSSTLSKIGRGD